MKTPHEQVLKIIKDWGYRILEEGESYINFIFRLNNVLCLFELDDDTYYSVGLSYPFEEKDKAKYIKLCNEVNKTKKIVKAIIVEDNRIYISAEFLCYDTKDLPTLLKRTLELVVSAKKDFDNYVE